LKQACDVGFREVRIENALLLGGSKTAEIRGVNRHEHVSSAAVQVVGMS
jgi:beta-galactosidase